MSTLMGGRPKGQLDTSYLKAQGYDIPPGGMPSPVAPSASAGPQVVLEVRDEGRHLEAIPLPMDRAVYIEDIVREADLADRLGRLSISIMRPNGSGAPPVHLRLTTNDKGKAADMGQNYALLPGDHIIVSGDRRSGFERIIDRHFMGG